MQDNTNSPPPAGRRAFSCPNQDKSLCFLALPFGKGSTHTNLLVGVTPRGENTENDYQPPVTDLPPRAHDHKAGGSSSASDPALLAILEGMRADQRRVAEEKARRDRDQAAINAAVQARQDELQRQFLTF